MIKQKFTVWVLYNQTSNQYKLEQFQKTVASQSLRIALINTEEVWLSVDDSQPLVEVSGKQVELPDFCISLIVDRQGNEYAFTIFEYLEAFKIPFLNSLDSVEIASNKFLGATLLKEANFATPDTYLVLSQEVERYLEDNSITFPFVLKPVHGRKSRGVSIIRSSEDLHRYLTQNEKSELLLQEFVSESFRKDIRVYILGEKVLGAIQRTAHAKTFSQVTAEKIDLSRELEQRSLAIAKLFKLNFCCVDYFVDAQNSVCEVNSHPGFVKFESVFETSLVAEIYNHVLDRLHLQSE